MLFWVVTTRRDIQEVHAHVSDCTGKSDRILNFPTLHVLIFQPVSRAYAEEEGHVFRNGLARQFDHLARQSGAIFETTTVFVRALIGRRRYERMQ